MVCCSLEAEAEAGCGRARGSCSFERKSSFFSQLVEWFPANPQFEQSLVRVLSRAGVLLAFVDAVDGSSSKMAVLNTKRAPGEVAGLPE